MNAWIPVIVELLPGILKWVDGFKAGSGGRGPTDAEIAAMLASDKDSVAAFEKAWLEAHP